MNRASPVDLRKAMDAAKAMCDAGILFVPVPVTSDIDHQLLRASIDKRLIMLEAEAEE